MSDSYGLVSVHSCMLCVISTHAAVHSSCKCVSNTKLTEGAHVVEVIVVLVV